jgi:CHAD domain-containing protein
MPDGKWIEGLTPEMPVADAARVVLAARFGVVAHYLPLAAERPHEDIEYVHQLRVGTRRAAAALRVFADHLPKKSRKAARRRLRTVRQAAGAARDWDVFLAGLGDVPAMKAAAGKPALDFLRGYCLAERAAVQVPLLEAAEEAGPWFADAAQGLADHVKGEVAEEHTLGNLAGQHLHDHFVEFTAAIAADPDDPAALHQVRIAAKRLRYEMEIFAACAAPPLREQLYPAVEALQELLGGTQDAAVAVERLENLRDRVKANLPDEWKRISPGVTGLLRAFRSRVKSAPAAFRKWRARWESLMKQYPLASLLPGTSATAIA